MTGDGIELERARCLGIALECLEHGHLAPCSKEFADGYSLAAQEIAAEIIRASEDDPL
jgi:hypothetical protein